MLPFFRLLKKGFEWIEDSERSFQDLKQHLACLPALDRMVQGKDLYLYLVVSEVVVSSVLVRDEHCQIPVYYVSRAPHGVELKYPPLEKLAFVLVITTRRLRPYFQAHPIVVLTNQPLRAVLQKPKLSRRLVKWPIELGKYDVSYRLRTAIKG